MKKTYYAAVSGDILGAYREVGEPVLATDREAKYLEMAGQITSEPPKAVEPPHKPEPSPATLDRKTR